MCMIVFIEVNKWDWWQPMVAMHDQVSKEICLGSIWTNCVLFHVVWEDRLCHKDM